MLAGRPPQTSEREDALEAPQAPRRSSTAMNELPLGPFQPHWQPDPAGSEAPTRVHKGAAGEGADKMGDHRQVNTWADKWMDLARGCQLVRRVLRRCLECMPLVPVASKERMQALVFKPGCTTIPRATCCTPPSSPLYAPPLAPTQSAGSRRACCTGELSTAPLLLGLKEGGSRTACRSGLPLSAGAAAAVAAAAAALELRSACSSTSAGGMTRCGGGGGSRAGAAAAAKCAASSASSASASSAQLLREAGRWVPAAVAAPSPASSPSTPPSCCSSS